MLVYLVGVNYGGRQQKARSSRCRVLERNYVSWKVGGSGGEQKSWMVNFWCSKNVVLEQLWECKRGKIVVCVCVLYHSTWWCILLSKKGQRRQVLGYSYSLNMLTLMCLFICSSWVAGYRNIELNEGLMMDIFGVWNLSFFDGFIFIELKTKLKVAFYWYSTFRAELLKVEYKRDFRNS